MTGDTPVEPKFYKTPKGRIVAANESLDRMVSNQLGKYGSYAPCDEDGNIVMSTTGEATMPVSQHHLELEGAQKVAFEQGVEQGWTEARAELAPAIEEAKAEAVKEASEAAAVALDAAKAEAFEAGKAAGLEEAKAKPTGKKSK